MTATQSHGTCCCPCGQRITIGAQFEIHDGLFYLAGHRRADLLDNTAAATSPDPMTRDTAQAEQADAHRIAVHQLTLELAI
jgi:hypothetical protein